MNCYKIMLVGKSPGLERTGFVYCAGDEQARLAARALLQFHLDYATALAFEDERLVCEVQRDGAARKPSASKDAPKGPVGRT